MTLYVVILNEPPFYKSDICLILKRSHKNFLLIKNKYDMHVLLENRIFKIMVFCKIVSNHAGTIEEIVEARKATISFTLLIR